MKRKTFVHCVWERKEIATTIFLNFIYSLNTIFIELKGIKEAGGGGGTGWRSSGSFVLNQMKLNNSISFI